VITLETTIGNAALLLECDPDLQSLAGRVMDKIAAAHRQGLRIVDGAHIQIGWSVLTLKAENGRLRVCEPHFGANPFEQLEPTVSITLRVLEAQVRLLRRVGEAGVDVTYDQLVLATPAALASPGIYLKRLDPLSPQDTGWFIGALIGSSHRIEEASDVRALAVFELFQMRPAVLQVLALPPGSIVTMSGDAVEHVFDSEGRDRWAG
jgi:hypothetical protein